MIATLTQTTNKITPDKIKEYYLYAQDSIKNTTDEYKKMKFLVERNFNVLGGRQGVVLGRDCDDNLVTLNNIKSEKDLRLALGYLSDYISNADTRTASLAEARAAEIYTALEYLQGTLPVFRSMMVMRVACKRFVKSVRGVQRGELEVKGAVQNILHNFSPSNIENLCAKEKHKVEDVLVSSIRNFQKTRLRNLKDLEFDVLEAIEEIINYVEERGFTRYLNNWDKDMDEYIRDLYIFADNYVEDGRVSKGLKNRVKELHDLADRREILLEQIKECEKDLKEYDEHLKQEGFKIRDSF